MKREDLEKLLFHFAVEAIIEKLRGYKGETGQPGSKVSFTF